ncbi:MAG: hypothetical protein KA715_00060 [Xanthomonadaceae bacterium]|nr:hypothetical protein [Xanthomonadaceae bacterium]
MSSQSKPSKTTIESLREFKKAFNDKLKQEPSDELVKIIGEITESSDSEKEPAAARSPEASV